MEATDNQSLSLFLYLYSTPLAKKDKDAGTYKLIQLLSYKAEIMAIKKKIQMSGQCVAFEQLVATGKSLKESLDREPQILHFCGHG